jgi:hypothetical protein
VLLAKQIHGNLIAVLYRKERKECLGQGAFSLGSFDRDADSWIHFKNFERMALQPSEIGAKP